MKILLVLALFVPFSSQNNKGPIISLAWFVKLESKCRHNEQCNYTNMDAEPEFRTQSAYKNDIISKIGNDYILSEKVSDVEFSCKADYPIRWTVPFPEQFLQMDSLESDVLETISVRSSSPSATGQPRNSGFESVLRLRNLNWNENFLSVNFTCESMDSLTTGSIHIFRQGEHKIENQGTTIEALVDSRETYFILPCRPALPQMTVILEKQISNETFEEIHVSPPKLLFDPKFGFTMSKDFSGGKIYGIYRCRVENETDGFVYVNVTEQVMSDGDTGTGLMTEFKSFSKNERDAIVYKNDGQNQPWCCSGVPGVPPKTIMESCKLHSGDCDIRKKIFLEKVKNFDKYGDSRRPADFVLANERDDCSVVLLWDFTNAFVYCKGGDLEYMDNYVYRFRPNIQDIKNRTTGLDFRKKHLMNYDSANVVASLPTDRKIFIAVGQRDLDKENKTKPEDLEQGFLDFDCYRRSRTANRIPSSSHIREFDRNHYFEGEKLTFACFAVDAIYSVGIQLRVNWKNGSVIILPPPETCIAYMHFEGSGWEKEDKVSINKRELVNERFSQEIRADLEMESVECFAPRGDSEDWDVFEYELDIRPSVPTTTASTIEDS